MEPNEARANWPALITAAAVLLTALGGTLTNIAGLWRLPDFVTVEVLDDRIAALATLIVDERLARRDRAEALRFQITTTEKRLADMAADDPNRADNETMLEMLRAELAAHERGG